MPKTTEIISVHILQMHIMCAIIKLGGDIFVDIIWDKARSKIWQESQNPFCVFQCVLSYCFQ